MKKRAQRRRFLQKTHFSMGLRGLEKWMGRLPRETWREIMAYVEGGHAPSRQGGERQEAPRRHGAELVINVLKEKSGPSSPRRGDEKEQPRDGGEGRPNSQSGIALSLEGSAEVTRGPIGF